MFSFYILILKYIIKVNVHICILSNTKIKKSIGDKIADKILVIPLKKSIPGGELFLWL
jgi:hypothetical protein